jgi:hypothetical protein
MRRLRSLLPTARYDAFGPKRTDVTLPVIHTQNHQQIERFESVKQTCHTSSIRSGMLNYLNCVLQFRL